MNIYFPNNTIWKEKNIIWINIYIRKNHVWIFVKCEKISLIGKL